MLGESTAVSLIYTVAANNKSGVTESGYVRKSKRTYRVCDEGLTGGTVRGSSTDHEPGKGAALCRG